TVRARPLTRQSERSAYRKFIAVVLVCVSLPAGLLAGVALGLLADQALALVQLRRQCVAEVGRVEDLTQFDFRAAIERRFLQPLERLGLRRRLPDPEARDQFFRLGKRAVGHRRLAAVELDA